MCIVHRLEQAAVELNNARTAKRQERLISKAGIAAQPGYIHAAAGFRERSIHWRKRKTF